MQQLSFAVFLTAQGIRKALYGVYQTLEESPIIYMFFMMTLLQRSFYLVVIQHLELLL